MFWDVRFLMRDGEEVSSGASVTSLTMFWLRLEEPYIVEGEVVQGWKRELLWAPFLLGCRYRPSAWTPRRVAPPSILRGTEDGRIYCAFNE